jgi:DNA-binding HxlR family transcriptional regulator
MIAKRNQLHHKSGDAAVKPIAERGMEEAHRSRCPINLTLEILGDKWSLLVLRDMIFGGKRRFRELLRLEEGIASNVLADRLKTLVAEDLLTKADDPTHKQKAIYSLTEKAIALVPVLAQIGAWGGKWLAVSEEMGVRAKLLGEGGPRLWDQLMAELRAEHLGTLDDRAKRKAATVRAKLQKAYEETVRRKRLRIP